MQNNRVTKEYVTTRHSGARWVVAVYAGDSLSAAYTFPAFSEDKADAAFKIEMERLKQK